MTQEKLSVVWWMALVFEFIQKLYASTIVTGFAEIYGYPVGIVANHGVLFSESALKTAHFIELCDQRRIPLAFFAEHYRLYGRKKIRKPGDRQRRRKDGQCRFHYNCPETNDCNWWIVRSGKLWNVWSAFSPDFLWMWPNARISVMGGEQAANVLWTVKKDQKLAQGESVTAEEEVSFKAPILSDYEKNLPLFLVQRDFGMTGY